MKPSEIVEGAKGTSALPICSFRPMTRTRARFSERGGPHNDYFNGVIDEGHRAQHPCVQRLVPDLLRHRPSGGVIPNGE